MEQKMEQNRLMIQQLEELKLEELEKDAKIIISSNKIC